MKQIYLLIIFSFSSLMLSGQEIQMTEVASLEQVYGETTDSESLLPFNDLNIEFGYVLYEAQINIESAETILELENVRDYAVIYIDNKFQGTVTDNRKKVSLNVSEGTYTLQLYAENIGRITYGPEILDNSKGLFGGITLDGEDVEGWKITVLNVKDCDIDDLQFATQQTSEIPCFHKGHFEVTEPKDMYLDISGWGMGEAWINGQYLGSYWEEEKQQSIQVPAATFKTGKNEVVIFELKNNQQKTLQLSNEPVFK